MHGRQKKVALQTLFVEINTLFSYLIQTVSKCQLLRAIYLWESHVDLVKPALKPSGDHHAAATRGSHS